MKFNEKYISSYKEKVREMVEGLRKDEGGRQSREQPNTWYPDDPFNKVFNQALDDILSELEKI